MYNDEMIPMYFTLPELEHIQTALDIARDHLLEQPERQEMCEGLIASRIAGEKARISQAHKARNLEVQRAFSQLAFNTPYHRWNKAA
ncbi:MAG: hypothetical protein ACYTBJ_24585 [Planctomycetota bacterium]|jgi:hypothetical protein